MNIFNGFKIKHWFRFNRKSIFLYQNNPIISKTLSDFKKIYKNDKRN
jgi:hypothetical protein